MGRGRRRFRGTRNAPAELSDADSVGGGVAVAPTAPDDDALEVALAHDWATLPPRWRQAESGVIDLRDDADALDAVTPSEQGVDAVAHADLDALDLTVTEDDIRPDDDRRDEAIVADADATAEPVEEGAGTDVLIDDVSDETVAEAASDDPVVESFVLGDDWNPLGAILVRELGVDAGVVRTLVLDTSATDRLGARLVAARVVDDRTLAKALALQHGLEVIDLGRTTPDPSAVRLVPEAVAKPRSLIVVQADEQHATVAVSDPTLAGEHHAAIAELLDRPIEFVVAPESEIRRAIETSYKSTERISQVVAAYEALAQSRPQVEVAPLAAVDENAPVVQVVTLILEQAVRDRASDVHIEPLGDRVRVRNRTDGALHEVLSLPEAMAQPLVSRIKVMSDLNIVERRRPQDGQFGIDVADRSLDVRVSTTSTMFGEKCVLRLLDKTRATYELSDLGMPPDTRERFKNLVRSPYGMVICAGPTGSGKTTTLYASLAEIASEQVNVMTIEDPVEYVFPSINQIQINDQAGITFASGLRSILRQDPDAILVGEIRDVETARIAVQSALTGHFVMSSIHATDSTSALHRFLDMGIEPYLIASSLLGVVGQRLVRRICPSCRVPYEPTSEELAFYERAGGAPVEQFFHGEGCNFCGQTGYFERMGVYEVMHITDEVKALIVDNAPQAEIRRMAISQGMRTLTDEAVDLVAGGSTTIAEVLRTVYVL